MNPEPVSTVYATPADWEALRHSQSQDYDGHTLFADLSPAARLAWLEAAVEFVMEARGRTELA
jgi:hypothetical protein